MLAHQHFVNYLMCSHIFLLNWYQFDATAIDIINIFFCFCQFLQDATCVLVDSGVGSTAYLDTTVYLLFYFLEEWHTLVPSSSI